MDVVLISLMAFLIVGSIVALQMKDLLSAVVALGVVGLGLSILFLLLGAPDIAITQVVVEVIVVTVLIRACDRVSPERPQLRRNLSARLAGLGLLLVFAGFVVAGLAALPAFGSAEHPMALWLLANAPELTGSPNVVTAVLLDVRAYDTLGEATVILTAVVGTIAVLRSQPLEDARAVTDASSNGEAAATSGTSPRASVKQASTRAGMSLIVRTVTRWLFPMMLVFGFAVALFGHLSPGGGFAGGVVIACSFVLATLAFGAKAGPSASFRRVVSVVESFGALSFLGLALLGYTAGAFLTQWAGRGEAFTLGSTPSVVLLNVAILLKVGAGLFAGFVAVATFERGPAMKKGDLR